VPRTREVQLRVVKRLGQLVCNPPSSTASPSGEQNRVARGTLAEAQRTAYQCAIERQRCNLTVFDAYHHVLIGQDEQAATLAGAGT